MLGIPGVGFHYLGYLFRCVSWVLGSVLAVGMCMKRSAELDAVFACQGFTGPWGGSEVG